MKIGKNVMISPRAVIYNEDKLEIGDNVRIDDFCVLSCGGRLTIGNHVHIACYTALYGGYGIEIGDFVGISAHCAIYSASDDYSGRAMSNPTVPDRFKRVQSGRVRIGRHVLIGQGSTVMPDLVIGEGAAIGAHSFVNADCEEWMIYAGVPARIMNPRLKNVLKLEMEMQHG